MGHNFVKNGQNKNQKPHAHLYMIRRQSIKFQISPTKDVRDGKDGRKDGLNDGRKDGRTGAHTDGRGSFL